jgi:hypothetical protein
MSVLIKMEAGGWRRDELTEVGAEGKFSGTSSTCSWSWMSPMRLSSSCGGERSISAVDEEMEDLGIDQIREDKEDDAWYPEARVARSNLRAMRGILQLHASISLFFNPKSSLTTTS